MKNFLVLAMYVVLFYTTVAVRYSLNVGALFELTNHWFDPFANFYVSVVEHAFEEIENRTDILTDYSLKLIVKDTQVFK